MAKCRLCNDREATKTNSHILPHSLIKSATNKDGSKHRDYELTFGLSGKEFVDTFFGRSITLETIQVVMGRELSEKEMKAQNPFANDYLFCPKCESNIGVLESYYIQEIQDKLRKGNYHIAHKDSKSNDIVEFQGADLEIVLLFIYSIFFRCSVSKFNGYNLHKWEEKFRKVLYSFLYDSIPKIKAKIKDNPSDFLYLPMIHTFFKKDGDEDPTKNFVTVLHSRIPLFVYVNEMTFHLYTKEKHLGRSVEHFYGINSMVDSKKSVNRKEHPLKVVILTQDQLERVLENAYGNMASHLITFHKKVFREIHKICFNIKPSDELSNYYIQKLMHNEAPLGGKYSMQNAAKTIYETLKIAYQIS